MLHQAPQPSTRDLIVKVLADHYRELGGIVDSAAPRFSIARCIAEMTTERGLNSGYEKEVCGGAAIARGTQHDPHRVVIPFAAIAQRTMTAASGPAGGYLIGADTLRAADVLRPWSVTARAGVQFMENLRSNILIPRVSSAPTGQWLPTEYTVVPDSTPTLGQVSMAPRLYCVITEFSTQLARQSAAEDFLRSQLLSAAAAALDGAVLAGSGANGEPLGLTNSTDIPTQPGASFAWDDATAILETLGDARLDDARSVFIAAPDARKILQAREKISGSARFVWDDDRIANRPAIATADMPSATMLTGDWSRVLVGFWGSGIELQINPFQDFQRGIFAARVLLSCDVALTQPTAFVKSTAIT